VPAGLRAVVSYVEVEYQMRERHACRLMGLGRSTHRYRAQKAERDSELRTRLKELATRRMRFGYRRLTAMLLREVMPANHKRVYRMLTMVDDCTREFRPSRSVPRWVDFGCGACWIGS
jgi:putative transposase